MKETPKRGLFTRGNGSTAKKSATAPVRGATQARPGDLEPALQLTDGDLEMVVGGLAKPKLPGSTACR